MLSALDILRQLTSVPTAPYFEEAVTLKALSWCRKYLRHVSIKRHRGGLIVSYRGAGKGPALALAAHLDHPAFHLSQVNAYGALAHLQGGLPPRLLKGCRVEAFAANPRDNRPLAVGILGTEKKKGFYPVRWTRPPEKNKPAFAILALTPFSIDGRWLHSRSIDDLLGCAVSLEALRRVAAAGLKTNLTVLLHRAEELGFIGALDLIRQGKVSISDSILSIESSRELPGARPGKGPVIRLGDKACAFDPNLTALLDAAAARIKKRGLAAQRLRLTGGTCEATAYLAFGYEASGVAVPLVNYHNGWGAKAVAAEKVRLRDVAGAVSLLVETARLFPSFKLRAGLRAGLEIRHRKNVRNLAKLVS